MNDSSSDEISKKMEISASIDSANDEDFSALKNDFEKTTMILKRSTENEAQPMEIIEENNNDSMNKMDIERSNENIIDNDNDNDNNSDDNMEILEMPINPKPGCSKDSDFLEKIQINEAVQDKKALKIQGILPKKFSSFEKCDLLMGGQENFKKEVFQLFGEQSLIRSDAEDVFVAATNSKEFGLNVRAKEEGNSTNQNNSGKLTSREEMIMISNNATDDEELVLKKRIITHGNDTLVVSADNLIQSPINLPEIPIASIDEVKALPKAPTNVKNTEYCQEIYKELCTIFPNMKKEYIKNITPAEWTPNVGHALQISEIVEKLLASEAAWQLEDPEDKTDDLIGAVEGTVEGTNVNSEKIDEIYERLLKRFPEADPTNLRTHAELVYNNDQIFQESIEDDYPLHERYISQMRMTQEQSSYTKNFTVQGFLKKFPDPFDHFLDKTRQCQENPMVFEFLKYHFNKIQVSTISKVYKDSDWNMSIAASKLAEIGSEMSVMREDEAYKPPKDINLLQEMAFVLHQKAIKEHIVKLEKAEKLEFEALKNSNKLLECECCYDSECMPSKCSKCENGHIFCNSCIINATDTRLADGETHVPCLQACDSEFSLVTLQKILKPKKFSILLMKRKAAELAAAELKGYVECPFCYFASILSPNIKVFKCLNPECMKESCIQCKELNHAPLQCYQAIKLDEALDLRLCNKCKRAYYKEGGCNKINCPCGAIICYVCNKEIEGYSHFDRQGDMYKCPLRPDDDEFNAENINGGAGEAELLRLDPGLNVNVQHVLLNVPRHLAGGRVADEARAELLRQDPGLNINVGHLLFNVPRHLAGGRVAYEAELLRLNPGLNINVEHLLLNILQQLDGLRQQVMQALMRCRMPNLNQDIDQRPAGEEPH